MKQNFNISVIEAFRSYFPTKEIFRKVKKLTSDLTSRVGPRVEDWNMRFYIHSSKACDRDLWKALIGNYSTLGLHQEVSQKETNSLILTFRHCAFLALLNSAPWCNCWLLSALLGAGKWRNSDRILQFFENVKNWVKWALGERQNSVCFISLVFSLKQSREKFINITESEILFFTITVSLSLEKEPLIWISVFLWNLTPVFFSTEMFSNVKQCFNRFLIKIYLQSTNEAKTSETPLTIYSFKLF